MGIFGFGNSETIYLPGCFSMAFLENKSSNYGRILKKLGIDFWTPKENDFKCCGGFLEEAGYEKQFWQTARENFSFFEKKGIKKIITSCALCHTIFSDNYKNMLPNWNIEVEFVLSTILNKLLEDNSIVRDYSNEDVVYYDSCCLGRYLKLHDVPRTMLKLFGYKVLELPDSKEDTPCCGSCGNLPNTNPELAKKIARDFINRAKKKGIKKIITADPRAYRHLVENLDDNETFLEIMEFSDIICEALDIKQK